MAKVGVLIEIEHNSVKEINNGVLTAARNGGSNEVIAFIFEGDPDGVKTDLAEQGVAKIVKITGKGTDLLNYPDFQAKALSEVIHAFALDALLGLASAKGRDQFARLSALMDIPLAMDCVGINFQDRTIIKSHFSGKTFATFNLATDPILCTIRPNAINPKPAPGNPETESYMITAADPGGVKIVETKKGDSDKIDLTEASVIITGGRPMGSADNYKILQECAALLGAAVGASRAAVDAGYASHSMQVGQTGKTVSPVLYIGCGLSGSVQHFAGMKTSKVIVAINTNKDAPIFQKCDYGIIGDLFEVVPTLTEVLREQAGK